MLICRIAYDAMGKDVERIELLEAHRSHLRSGKARVVQSGPLFDQKGKRGALVVFEVENLAEVQQFNAQDPYITHGVYDRVELVRWEKTIG